jgi:hypothetical protein
MGSGMKVSESLHLAIARTTNIKIKILVIFIVSLVCKVEMQEEAKTLSGG